MPVLRLLQSTTFRLALIYMIFFAVSVFGLLMFVYVSASDFMSEQTDRIILNEITGITDQYRDDGIGRLITVVQRRSREATDGLYLLAQFDNTPVAGNMNVWPEAEKDEKGYIEFTFERPTEDGPQARVARARVFEVAGSFKLLVGRDVESRLQIENMIRTTLAWAMAITGALGLLGGGLLARYMMGRLDEINRTSSAIMGGDFSHRVPVRGSGDEIDQLAENLNAMLSQIERLMEGMRQVTDNIAHDLRSPLNRLRNRIEVTLIEKGGKDEYETALRHTIEEADDLIATFNALLSIAQIEAGAIRDEMGDVNICAVAQDVVELYEPVAEEAGVTLNTEIHETVIVHGNRELLSQSMANLVDNAIKYCSPGDAVFVKAGYDQGRAVLEVCDTGPGIPPEDRERVTRRFVRLEASRNEPGSGLGLSLVAATARLHSGQFELADGPEGRGLAARLVIPLAYS